MRFSAMEKFSSITLRPIMAGNKIDFNIYSHTPYERSIERHHKVFRRCSFRRILCGLFKLHAFEPGEYLVVFDGGPR